MYDSQAQNDIIIWVCLTCTPVIHVNIDNAYYVWIKYTIYDIKILWNLNT